MPKLAKTSNLWLRFIAALHDLPRPKSDDQTEIGRAVGVRQTMISAYKTGAKGPSMKAAIRLATYAEMCVQYLLTEEGPQRPWGTVDDEFKKLVMYWENLTDEGRAKLLERGEELFTLQGKPRRPRLAPQTGDTSTKLPTLPKKPRH